MSRNDGSRFALAPQVDIQRSRFNRDFNIKTSFNVGDLIPLYVDEVLPGDTVSIKTSKLLRLQTLITPVMDNLYFDVYWFFVPNRLVWEHWEEFMGANKTSEWIPQVQYSVPQTYPPQVSGWDTGTVADYMGIPVDVDFKSGANYGVSSLPFRAYAKVCEDWFRDESTMQPVSVSTGDGATQGHNNPNDFITGPECGGAPFKVSKYHDFFTSCTPSPQRGPSVLLPLGNIAPVTTGSTNHLSIGDEANKMNWAYRTNADEELKTFTAATGLGIPNGGENLRGYGVSGSPSDVYPVPTNLYADLTQATNTTINELRMAFQIQRLYERDARAGGGRYVEQLRAHFGVTSPDARLQRSEYLGGNRFPFNVQQVSQTSSSDSTTPQGNLAGFSVTANVNHDFTKSFTEHGILLCVACARYSHSYQRSLERMWTRTDRFHYYYPALANIGEQAVKKRELDCRGASSDLDVFGYQEAWAEYRYKPNKITGEMNSAANGALDSWHFGDDYRNVAPPTLSAGWMREDAANVDRALAVTSAVSHQIFGDIFFDATWTRPMPLYSVPGYIDHM